MSKNLFSCKEYSGILQPFIEVIQTEVVNSFCLVPGSENPADAMTKPRENGKLKIAIRLGNYGTPLTKLFMPQTLQCPR